MYREAVDKVPQLVKIGGGLVISFKGIRGLLLIVLLVALVPPAFVHGMMVPPGELCLVGPDASCSLLLTGTGIGHPLCDNCF